MPAPQRPYRLRNKQTGEIRLVAASTVAQAVRHVASVWDGRAATALEVGELTSRHGVKMEIAGEEAEQGELLPPGLPKAEDLDLAPQEG